MEPRVDDEVTAEALAAIPAGLERAKALVVEAKHTVSLVPPIAVEPLQELNWRHTHAQAPSQT